MLRWLRFWDRRRTRSEVESDPLRDRKSPAPSPPPPLSDVVAALSPEHQSLLRALEDPSPEVCGRAAKALSRAGPPVVPALAEQLGHAEPHVRRAAIQALGDMGPDAALALAALVRAAIDRDEGVRQLASRMLVRVDPAWPIAPATRLAVPALVDGLRSSLPWVTRAAAEQLVRVGRPAVPALIDLLADWEAEAHRQAALRILGQLGPSAGEAAPVLATILADSDPAYRQAAAETLARLGAAAAPVVPALIRALSDWSPPVRQGAAQTLAAVGAPAAHAIPTLLGMLSDYDDGAREAAVAALGGIGEPAVPFLALVLQERELNRAGDRSQFREEVDRLWRRLDAERSHGTPDQVWRKLTWAAREGLRVRTDIVHQSAATALGRVGPAAAAIATPALAQALCDENHRVRLAAARALGEIGPGARAALPPLAAMLVNGTESLRKAAAGALPRIDEDWSCGGSEPAEVLPVLVARLHEDGPRGVEASDALVLIGREAAPALSRALASDDQAIREAAARTLGRIGPAAEFAVPALTAALRDPRDGVRAAAALALAMVMPVSG